MTENLHVSKNGYVELHARSAFSFLRGASLPEDLAAEAARLGLPALALLDRDGVYGAPRLYQSARSLGVRPLVGAEITLEDGAALPLLVATRTGYQNLCRLITTAKLTPRLNQSVPPGLPPGADPRERKRPCFATWAEVAAHAEGLIALGGDEEGPLLRAWARGGKQALAAALDSLEAIFGRDRLYVEVQRRRERRDHESVRLMVDVARARGLPLLATGGVLHATREGRPIADVFTCLREHTTLDGAGRRLLANAERHLRSPAAMRALFADLPEAADNTVRLAARLEFTLENLGYTFPKYPVGEGDTMPGALRRLTFDGAAKRMGRLTPKIRTQLEHELALIARLGFDGYFLIVADICSWCRERGILSQGRGSAANSAVCFSIGITAINPMEHNLLFERFLSEGRVGADGRPSWPDIDIDLPSGDLRESVIQEVYRRYRERGAALVANVITFRGRSTARELGKVLGLPEDVLDRFSALYAAGDFPNTLELEQQVRASGLPVAHPRFRALIDLFRQIKGLPRHLGQHSGGMILCPGMLDQIVPIENASMENRTIVQWDKDDCEDLGLIKIDFLGLGMMAVLQDTLALCRDRGGPGQLHEIPHDDTATYDTMCRAETVGVFQIESRAQMATLPRFRPRCFYDVAMQVSIVRPGPIVGELVYPLIRRRQGLEPITYLDPSVEAIVKPTLERTCGVILYQEQMLKLAMDLADFTGAEAEELRRAMGFTRKRDRLMRAVEKLGTAMRAKGHAESVIAKVVQSCSSFAAYGFPESHALSFGLLAYASTWLKVHRPAEFFASLLNNQPLGFYSPATLVQDARRMRLVFRPACIVYSEFNYTVERSDVVRVGLRQIRGLRQVSVEAMVAERQRRAFRSLEDFLARTTFTASERRVLASVGALNALAPHRRAALWQIEAAWSADETLFRQPDLELDSPSEPIASPLAPMSHTERLAADFAGMQITVGSHPMALVRARLPSVWRAADLTLGKTGETVEIAGSVICRQRPGTAKGFVFISLEDETGIANAVVRPDLFEASRLVVNEESALRIVGRLQNQNGVIHVRAIEIKPLRFAEVPAQASHDFH